MYRDQDHRVTRRSCWSVFLPFFFLIPLMRCFSLFHWLLWFLLYIQFSFLRLCQQFKHNSLRSKYFLCVFFYFWSFFMCLPEASLRLSTAPAYTFVWKWKALTLRETSLRCRGLIFVLVLGEIASLISHFCSVTSDNCTDHKHFRTGRKLLDSYWLFKNIVCS